MSTIALETPEAAALSAAIHSKIVDEGWTPDDDTSLADYIVLMLANGKTQDQIASELAGELLQDAKGTPEFAQWLFEQVNALSSGSAGAAPESSMHTMQAQSAGGEMSVDSGDNTLSAIPAAYDMDIGDTAPENAPRGPKGLHGGRPSNRGGRGGISKGGDAALHRVRGNDRINSHGNVRGAPKGPRGQGREARPGMQKALNGLLSGPSQGMPNQMMQNSSQPGMMSAQQQMEMLAMMEQQTRMMAAMMQAGQSNPFQQQQQNGGRSLADRIEPARGRGGRGRGRGANQNGANRGGGVSGSKTGEADTAMETDAAGDSAMETEASGEAQRKQQDPATTMCHFNLRCTNKDCIYVHQSPAAPEGVVVNMDETCTFGAACKNAQCVGKHPSPAQAKSQELCKFFPNCSKPNCPFKHPSMPPCRFGANCKTPNCQFTHLPAPACRFNPCTNARCPFKHEPGQQKIPNLSDYQWTPDSAKKAEQGGHVSERKFVADDEGEEELIRPDGTVAGNGETTMREEVTT